MLIDERCWGALESFSNDLGWRVIRKGVRGLQNEGM
jgi:hypothetical protein